MAQSAQTLYDGLRRDDLVSVRMTPQDYRFPLLFLVRLIRNVLWADVIHIQISGVVTLLTNAVIAVIIGDRLGKRAIIAYKGGYPEKFLARYDLFLRRFLRKTNLLVTTAWAAGCFRRLGYLPWVMPNVVEVADFQDVRREPACEHLLLCRHLKLRYNIPMALHAFKAIKLEFPAATLSIVGDGSMRDHLDRLSKQLALGGVVFRSSVPHSDLPKIYARADLFLNPTDAVGIPVSLIEAAAAGLVIISIDSGGIREFVQHGINGFLVPPDDSRTMAKYALMALREPKLRRKLGNAAKRAAARYSWQKLRVKYYTMYHILVTSQQGVRIASKAVAHTNQSA